MSQSSYLPVIAAFWVGPYLSWIEQIGLLSFVRHGHRVILYAKGEVKNVPPGVEVRPSQEIWDEDEIKIFLEAERWDPPNPLVINSDFFKWHLQRKTDYIYMDADRFCLQPFSMFSRQELAEKGAVLSGSRFFRLPENSPTAELACRFLSQKQPMPWWFSFKDRRRLFLRKITGRPKPVTHMLQPAAGDEFLEHALQKTGENVYDGRHFGRLMQTREVRNLFYFSAEYFESRLLKRHHVLIFNWPHLYHNAPRKFLETPPENSWIGQQAMALGVIPSDAPVIETRQKNNEYAGSTCVI